MGARTGRIETFLKGEKDGNRSGDGIIKKEMIDVIDSRFLQQAAAVRRNEDHDRHRVVEQLGASTSGSMKCADLDPEEQEEYYREHIHAAPLCAAQAGDGRMVCRLVLAHG